MSQAIKSQIAAINAATEAIKQIAVEIRKEMQL